jgi:hypothetical protein
MKENQEIVDKYEREIEMYNFVNNLNNSVYIATI